MPIVDGLTSTKIIRSFEKSYPDTLSLRASVNGRVPIFAVSASLVEHERQTYINAGFDGWILKPIDFKRLGMLLMGIVEEKERNKCLYTPGSWEKGGWFHRRQLSVLRSVTIPSDMAPVQNPPKNVSQLDGTSTHSSESGSITPKGEPRKPLIHDERLDEPKEVKFENSLSAVEHRVVADVSDDP
jgi:CheY-like chemotaxis protein